MPDFYCQLCDKDFQSQNALENHKNSKMHKKNMKILIEHVGEEEEIQNFVS